MTHAPTPPDLTRAANTGAYVGFLAGGLLIWLINEVPDAAWWQATLVGWAGITAAQAIARMIVRGLS